MHVTPADPPAILIHGDQDKAVSIQQSRQLIERLNGAKVPARLVAREGSGHAYRPLDCLRSARTVPSALLAIVLLAASGCGNADVVTQSYATLEEAEAAGAVERGWLPRGLPTGTHEIREAHDLDSNRRWGLFNFPGRDSDRLRSILGDELSLAGETCNPPRRIEWWPVLLRQQLDHEKIAATGLKAYLLRDGGVIVAVNWQQGRAYYWTRE